MAKKDRLKQHYYNAIRQAGQEPKRNYRNQWKVIRDSYKAEGKHAPTVYEYSRAYTEAQQASQEYIPTIDFATQRIEQFIDHLTQIRNDTMAYIDNNKEGTHQSGKLASISQYKIEYIDRVYYACLDELRKIINTYGAEITAQAIVDNVELDYDIAITLMPPSDVYVEFEATLEQMLAIENQLSVRADELARQAEDEYNGV